MIFRRHFGVCIKSQWQTRCVGVRVQRLRPCAGLALIIIKGSKGSKGCHCTVLLRRHTWARCSRRLKCCRRLETILGVRSRGSRRARLSPDSVTVSSAATADRSTDDSAVRFGIQCPPQLRPFAGTQGVLVLGLADDFAWRAAEARGRRVGWIRWCCGGRIRKFRQGSDVCEFIVGQIALLIGMRGAVLNIGRLGRGRATLRTSGGCWRTERVLNRSATVAVFV